MLPHGRELGTGANSRSKESLPFSPEAGHEEFSALPLKIGHKTLIPRGAFCPGGKEHPYPQRREECEPTGRLSSLWFTTCRPSLSPPSRTSAPLPTEAQFGLLLGVSVLEHPCATQDVYSIHVSALPLFIRHLP